MGLVIRQFATGGDRNFGYVAADRRGKNAVLVDPSPDPGGVLAFLRNEGLTVRYVFVTHGHGDHTGGSILAGKATGAPVLRFGDTDPESGEKVRHRARFPLGAFEVTVLHTPGHTVDSICLLAGDALFSGDTLFVGKVGGTGFGGDGKAQYDSLHRVLLALPDGTRVFPGHDYGTAAESSIGRERSSNPFLLQRDLESFIDLKRNWAAYKQAHGIP